MAAKYLSSLVATNLTAPMALRATFMMQTIFMLVNNMLFFCIWWIFFAKFPEVNGWGIHEMEALYGITAGAFGLFAVLGSGARQIARKVFNGELDSILVQPKDPLVLQSASYSQPSGWGDIVTAVYLVAISGYAHGWNLLLIPGFIVSGAAIFWASVVIANSLAFWAGQIEHVAQQYFEHTITFSVYPQNIFPVYFKFVLFSILPAGFIAYLPVVILKDGDWVMLPVLLLAVLAYVLLARGVFSRGLRRYESGNRMT